MSNALDSDGIMAFLSGYNNSNNMGRNGANTRGSSRPDTAAAAIAAAVPFGRLHQMLDELDRYGDPSRTNRPGHLRRGSSSSSSDATRSTARSDGWDSASYQSSEQTARTVPSSRRRLPSELAHIIAHQTPNNGAFILPCEFAGYSGCDRNFHPDDTDAWIEHIIVDHLHDRLPIKTLCWFCDDFTFDARKGKRGSDRRANFDDRMEHIRNHIRDDGYTVHNVRPDFFFLEHLRQCRLVSIDTYYKAREWHEVPHQMEGIYDHDFESPERQKEGIRQKEVHHDLAREERMRRRLRK